MIIYGYRFDFNPSDLTPGERRDLAALGDEGFVRYLGAGRQTAVVGVTLDRTSFLFSPAALGDLKTEPTPAQRAQLIAAWDKVPEALRAKSGDQIPKIYLFDTSDD